MTTVNKTHEVRLNKQFETKKKLKIIKIACHSYPMPVH